MGKQGFQTDFNQCQRRLQESVACHAQEKGCTPRRDLRNLTTPQKQLTATADRTSDLWTGDINQRSKKRSTKSTSEGKSAACVA